MQYKVTSDIGGSVGRVKQVRRLLSKSANSVERKMQPGSDVMTYK